MIRRRRYIIELINICHQSIDRSFLIDIIMEWQYVRQHTWYIKPLIDNFRYLDQVDTLAHTQTDIHIHTSFSQSIIWLEIYIPLSARFLLSFLFGNDQSFVQFKWLLFSRKLVRIGLVQISYTNTLYNKHQTIIKFE